MLGTKPTFSMTRRSRRIFFPGVRQTQFARSRDKLFILVIASGASRGGSEKGRQSKTCTLILPRDIPDEVELRRGECNATVRHASQIREDEFRVPRDRECEHGYLRVTSELGMSRGFSRIEVEESLEKLSAAGRITDSRFAPSRTVVLEGE